MKIAVMPGDGVGKEVIPQGLRVLKAAARKFGFTYDTTDYPFGAEHYLETGITLPDSALKELAAHDAIEQIKISTRQLARKQMKWFRRWGQVTWLPGDAELSQNIEQIRALWNPSSPSPQS